MAKFNSGEAIHYLNTAETVGQVEHRFKVACDLCCLDPAFMWKGKECNNMPTVNASDIRNAIEEAQNDRTERETDYNESLYTNRYWTPFQW